MPAPNFYALDNAREGTADLLDCLSAILDPPTVDLLDPLVPVGGRCLELGAGNGSVAGWMADRVGPTGVVVVTDLKPEHIRNDVRRHAAVRVLAHDLRSDPLPAGPFDVIHARLVLGHLPERDVLLPRLAGLLAPGGAMVVEEWGGTGPGRILHSPRSQTALLYEHYEQALGAILAAAGNDRGWSTRVNTAMTTAGLVDVQTVLQARSWPGGSAGCRLVIATVRQLGQQLADHGMNPADLDELLHDMSDPQVVLLGKHTWSTIGHRQP